MDVKTQVIVNSGDLVRTQLDPNTWRKVIRVDADGVQCRDYGGSWLPFAWISDVRRPVERVGDGPHCPYCHAQWTATQEGWGISWDCADCGHHEFMSIGD